MAHGGRSACKRFSQSRSTVPMRKRSDRIHDGEASWQRSQAFPKTLSQMHCSQQLLAPAVVSVEAVFPIGLHAVA
eukprot:6193198-Pleurochrysis_carterae.AAC.1